MNVMTMEVTPQRRNKHEINNQIKEKQSQTATETQNTAAAPFLGFLFCEFILCLFRLCEMTYIFITLINSSLNNLINIHLNHQIFHGNVKQHAGGMYFLQNSIKY